MISLAPDFRYAYCVSGPFVPNTIVQDLSDAFVLQRALPSRKTLEMSPRLNSRISDLSARWVTTAKPPSTNGLPVNSIKGLGTAHFRGTLPNFRPLYKTLNTWKLFIIFYLGRCRVNLDCKGRPALLCPTQSVGPRPPTCPSVSSRQTVPACLRTLPPRQPRQGGAAGPTWNPTGHYARVSLRT